jgi:ATP-dependent protease ClpP protease subunit
MKNLSKVLLSVLAAVLVVTGVSYVGSGSVLASSENGLIILSPDNTINFRGEVSSVTVFAAQLELQAKLLKRGGKDYPIYLVLNTPGGSIYDGENFIEFTKTKRNVHTITIFAASMGAIIVESLPGERLVLDSGILMFHRASGRFEGQFGDGEVEQQLEFWKNFVKNIDTRVSKRMGLDLEVYKDKIKDELWLRGSDAVKENAADRVVSVECTQELIDETEVLIESVMGIFEFETTYSKCPLLTSPVSVKAPNQE